MKTSVAIFLIAFSGLVVADEYSGNPADPASVTRGQTVYGKFCSKCHGVDGSGNGKDAAKYKPAPTNFRIAGAARAYMVEMTKKGGKAMGRSEDMPEWSADLTAEQIQDVVNYIMSVRIEK
jgi:mono/diheme cytochrome c family protein